MLRVKVKKWNFDLRDSFKVRFGLILSAGRLRDEDKLPPLNTFSFAG